MKSFISKIRKAVVVLGVSSLATPFSAWAAGPAVHSSGSATAFHATLHPLQLSASHAYVHPSSSGTSAAKRVASSSSALRVVQNRTNVTGGSTAPSTSKVNSSSSSQTTIAGNLVVKRTEKNPTG